MNAKNGAKTIILFSLASILLPQISLGGAVSGRNAQPTGFSCDNRTVFANAMSSWCTNVNANIIKNKCVVALHLNTRVQNCGWQGCKEISFVNERPVLKGSDVLEYGVSTPSGVTNLPVEWEFNNGSVMPKAPFPRHYLTVDQFITERSKCALLKPADLAAEISKGSVLGKICNVTIDVLNLNPYFFCMIQQKVITMPK